VICHGLFLRSLRSVTKAGRGGETPRSAASTCEAAEFLPLEIHDVDIYRQKIARPAGYRGDRCHRSACAGPTRAPRRMGRRAT
jgi:hypothetical protein